MAKISNILRSIDMGNGVKGVAFFCPGCQEMHSISIEGPGAIWQWDKNVDAPTFSPSILITSGHYVSTHKPGDRCWCTYNAEHPNKPAPFTCKRCHSFVRNGEIEFLMDCSHELMGKTVKIPDLAQRELEF